MKRLMMRSISYAAIAMGSTIYVPIAHADLGGVDAGPLSIGGRAAYFSSSDLGHTWYGGAQVRFHFLDSLAVEGSVDYRRQTINNDTPAETKVHDYPVQASLMFFPFPNSRLSPFILGGGGWYYTTVDGPGGYSNTQNRFGPHAGAGLEFYLSKQLSVDASYRYIWIEKVQSQDQSLANKDYKDDGHMVTAGLNFHF